MRAAVRTVLLANRSAISDPDARDYIAKVELADGQPLERIVRQAYNDFIVGAKNAGIWNAIKASCILVGARSLEGALTPLTGTAPTNFNFVEADYNRKTGLKGNGTTKYLSSNRNNNVDPQDNRHISIYVTEPDAIFNFGRYIAAGDSSQGDSYIVGSGFSPDLNFALCTGNVPLSGSVAGTTTGFIGVNRIDSSDMTARVTGASSSLGGGTSRTPRDEIFTVFGRPADGRFVDARMSFYSIGESVNLALLDTQLTTLMIALSNAIP
jgi:hypothetical protein